MVQVSTSAVRLTELEAVLPSVVTQDSCDDLATVATPESSEPQPISGFICTIEYADAHGEVSERFISCRRYEVHDGNPMVGAICGKSKRYKLFRCDRILEVSDAVTGQSLGDGSYFEQFTIGRIREKAHDWNTTSQRKSIIIAGLNVLCFLARCDGKWHPLEADVIEDFVCTLWMRKEWNGEPPLDLIRAHARRLAPDGEVFASAIRQYAHSNTSAAVLSRFVQRVIAADGVVCDHEHRWAAEFAELLASAKEAEAAARRSSTP